MIRFHLFSSRIALTLAGALLCTSTALASTAANTTITNTARVNYNDAGNNPQAPVTATASVTVSLVPSAVALSSPANQTISQGQSATLTYTLTATANGPDSYNLTSAVTASNLSTVSASFPGGSTVTLGGTTLATATVATDTSITVPYDGSGATDVNGIAVGDLIVVGSNAFTVTSVTKDSAANTATIGLSGQVGAVVAAGSIVGERQTFTVTVPSGTVQSGSSGTQTVATTATSATSAGATTTQSTPTVITVQAASLTVTKSVSIDNGATYLPSATAAPGTTLIYKIVATNSGSTSANSVAFTDVIPAYVSYISGSAASATSTATAYASATTLTEGSGGYNYDSPTRTVSYNPGGAAGTVAGSGGVLVLFFKAQIN